MIVDPNVVNRKGQRVQGLYCELPFVGRVVDSRVAYGQAIKHSIVIESIEHSDRIPKVAGETIIVNENPAAPTLVECC